MTQRKTVGLGVAWAALQLLPIAVAAENRVDIESDGWQLVGDLKVPESTGKMPAVLLCRVTVEQVILGGREHATGLLEEHPDLAERLAVWLSHKLN
jgi:hypothetical protein